MAEDNRGHDTGTQTSREPTPAEVQRRPPGTPTGRPGPAWPGSRPHRPPSPSVRRRRAATVAVVAALAAAGATVAVVTTRHHGPRPGLVAQEYLTAWSHNDFAAMARLVDGPPADFAAVHQQVNAGLNVSSAQYQAGAVTRHGNRAEVAYTAHLVLDSLGPIRYPSTVHLRLQGDRWLIQWSPATIHPALTAGARFRSDRVWAERASVLGAAGAVLAGPSTLVTIGLQGSAVKDPKVVTAALTQAGLSPAAIATALRAAAAHPDQFVPVADVPDSRYQEVKSIIFPIDGTRFRTRTGQSSLTPDLAAHIVGAVGPITADQLRQLGPPYQGSDVVGQGGLEALDERQLAGTPGGDVKIIDAAGNEAVTVATVKPKPGTPIQTSIDPHVEQAAETALNGVSQPAALVAMRASTGEVLAAVSRPVTAPFDRALEGHYPPGSTFKIITSSVLLGQGLTPDSGAMCPRTLTVGGRTFHNFEGEVAPSLTLQRAFAVSCNTAFIGLASALSPQSLVTAAAQFGFGTDPKVGLPAFGGVVPVPKDQVEKVAAAIGQARVEASPLQMAVVAATVDSGRVNAPKLVLGTAVAPGGTPLDPGVAASLRTMMAAVVTSGTGVAANLPGIPPVAGKTGTAEFGNATPPMTHAWFIGFRGDTAFAVLVEGGGVGAKVAVPIAAKFLGGL